ncbi:DNA replication and repair protein RecF, partial [bacterium]|nr:DNA replication and repair protein RecF [bacterium]
MRITQLEITDFRSYHHWTLEPDAALTVLVGPNAIGKTNIIEAVQLLSTGTSFRRAEWPDVVKWGARRALLRMTAEGEGSHIEVEVQVADDGTRQWRVGGQTKRRVADATRFVPVVAFTPDDLLLVKGPAEQRRSAADTLGEQLSATYGALRKDYARVVRQRNVLLRDEGDQETLSPWDQQLASLGARLHVHRRRLITRLAEAASPIYGHLAPGEHLTLELIDRCGVQGDESELTADVVEARITQ